MSTVVLFMAVRGIQRGRKLGRETPVRRTVRGFILRHTLGNDNGDNEADGAAAAGTPRAQPQAPADLLGPGLEVEEPKPPQLLGGRGSTLVCCQILEALP